MKAVKKFLSEFLAALFVVSCVSFTSLAASGSKPGYKLVNTYNDDGYVECELFVINGIASVGQVGIYYDDTLLSLAAKPYSADYTTDYENLDLEIGAFVEGHSENGYETVITNEGISVDALINEDEGEFYFAWYADGASFVDARSADKKVAEFRLFLNNGKTASDLEEGGEDIIKFAENKPKASGIILYSSGVYCANEEAEAFRNSANAKNKIVLSVEFENLDFAEEDIGGGDTGGGSVGGGAAPVDAFEVTYDAGTNGKIESGNTKENVAYGKSPAKAPQVKANDGYEFIGWALEGTSEIVDLEKYKVTKTVKFVAQYKEAEETQENPVKKFNDISEDKWYYKNVEYIVKNGLMNGVSESEFAPDMTLTRAMLVTILYRAAGSPAVNKSVPFEDVDIGAYYANPVIWAKQNNIVNGVSDTMFAPDTQITREQIATIMYRYAAFMKYDVSFAESTNLDAYTDAETVSSWALDGMKYAVGSGLIKGKTETTLNPLDNATRAESAAILQRFIEGNR